MRRLFLIRAYGDFVIAIRSVLKSSNPGETKLIVSLHLQPLYEAIAKVLDISALQVEFEDFKINNAQLNLFTDRYLLQQSTLEQVASIKKYLNTQVNDVYNDCLEQTRRKKIFEFATGKKFDPIVKRDRVYEEYAKSFNHSNEYIKADIPENAKVLILPDARIQKRNLPQEIVQEIIYSANIKNYNVQVAYFKRVNKVNKAGKTTSVMFKTDLKFTQTVYNNFDELIQLIMEADFVIGADSLPIHLSQFLSKPHFILYPDKGSMAFFTPFAIQQRYYCEFNEYESITIPFLA
ncbi:MAG: hypothetical protein RL363_281 [Bacteroidota bacterium]